MFVVNDDDSVDGTQDAGVAMLRAFNYIRKKENPVKALSFITDVGTWGVKGDEGGGTPGKQYVNILHKNLIYRSGAAIISKSSE